MKHIFKAAILSLSAVAALSLASCTDNDNSSEGGVLRVKLSTDTSVYTRADVGITAPNTEAFDLTVSAADQSYTNHWESISQLTSEEKFKTGDYTITASYGDLAAEGFDMPCFKAESSCRILPSQTTLVNMIAKLANCGVRVSMTSAFIQYFDEWDIELVSGNDTHIPFVEEESRIAYIAPEPFVLNVDYVKPNGTAGIKKIEVADVAPCTVYHIRLDVNGGEVGAAKIVVSFDYSTDDENIEIEIDEQ